MLLLVSSTGSTEIFIKKRRNRFDFFLFCPLSWLRGGGASELKRPLKRREKKLHVYIENTLKISFCLVVGSLRAGGGAKTPLTTKQENTFFSMIKKKWPEPHEKQESFFKKVHVMYGAGLYRSAKKGYK